MNLVSKQSKGLMIALFLLCITQMASIVFFYQQNKLILAQQEIISLNVDSLARIEEAKRLNAETNRLKQESLEMDKTINELADGNQQLKSYLDKLDEKKSSYQ